MKGILGRIILGRIMAFFLCVCGLPLHVAICLIIRLQDGGPALFRSERLGIGGRRYTMIKYRTMRVGCQPLLKYGFKVVVEEADSRITPLGRWLRCGIDELPQLWNIVRGEMAWIGPRPDEAWMLANYGTISYERLSIHPGITGLAQVLNSRYRSTATGYAIDVWYKRHGNVLMDAWIICVTPLFIAGCCAIGARRIQKLTRDTRFLALELACQEEISRAESCTP